MTLTFDKEPPANSEPTINAPDELTRALPEAPTLKSSDEARQLSISGQEYTARPDPPPTTKALDIASGGPEGGSPAYTQSNRDSKDGVEQIEPFKFDSWSDKKEKPTQFETDRPEDARYEAEPSHIAILTRAMKLGDDWGDNARAAEALGRYMQIKRTVAEVSLQCETCGGAGAGDTVCPACKGAGKTSNISAKVSAERAGIHARLGKPVLPDVCAICKGTGKMCAECNGRGVLAPPAAWYQEANIDLMAAKDEFTWYRCHIDPKSLRFLDAVCAGAEPASLVSSRIVDRNSRTMTGNAELRMILRAVAQTQADFDHLIKDPVLPSDWSREMQGFESRMRERASRVDREHSE